ncbi:MAG: TlpA family protein disulfide reductase [Ilumatobacteraceae bacterium]|nr:TlpA family protein disulfide reductase [Ilumatobacteraceae bacterium]
MPVRIRPRLLVASLAAAVVIGVGGGIVLGRTMADDDVPDDDIVLTEPGEYQQPLDAEGGAATGVALPSTTLYDLADAEVTTTELIGRPMVVNIWFTTCPPCARELADFAAVHAELGDAVRFVGVNPIDERDTMVRFADQRGVAYELYRDLGAAFVDALGVISYPTTLFVDADGTIVSTAGELDADELRARIEAVF